jgi:hypothetical protein
MYMRRIVTMKHTVTSATLSAILLCLGAITQAQAATVTYYACVSNSSGAIEIVGATTTCKTGFRKIQWNQRGPQGAPGPSGPAGPTGAQGLPAKTTGLFIQNTTPASVNESGIVYLQSAPVASGGVYFVNASALVTVSAYDGYGVACSIITSSTPDGLESLFGGPGQFGTIGMANVFELAAGDSIEVVCIGNSGDSVNNGSLWAILLDSVSARSKSEAARSHRQSSRNSALAVERGSARKLQ